MYFSSPLLLIPFHWEGKDPLSELADVNETQHSGRAVQRYSIEERKKKSQIFLKGKMLYIKTNWYWRENNHERGSLHKRLENIMTIIFLFFFLLFFLVWIGFLSHRLRVMYNKQWEQTPKVIRENRGGQSKKYLKTTVLVIASLRTKQQYWGTTTWNKSNPHTQKKKQFKNFAIVERSNAKLLL